MLCLLAIGQFSKGQDVELPVDFRQHNLTEYNSSLFSPVFSLDRNQPQSLALWSRWQWQMVDGDPSSVFFNYTRRINPSMAGGLAVFQHNTGVFLNRGGVLNYAFSTQIAPELEVAAGLNVFGYQRELADDRFILNPGIDLPGLDETKDFILQIAPSIQIRYAEVSLGMVVENLVEYNFRTKESEVIDNRNIFIGYLSSNFPINMVLGMDSSYIQPTLYFKRVPGFDDQVGITTLLSTPKFWVQGGYNSFYGISGGVGGRFFKNFSIGALVEFGTQSDLRDKDPTFELITAFNFGPRGKPEEDEMSLMEQEEPQMEMEKEPQPEQKKEIDEEQENLKIKADSLAQLEQQRRLQREQDSIVAARKIKEEKLAAEIQQQKLDSIAEAKKLEEQKAIIAKRRQDSIIAAQKIKEEELAAEIQQRRLDSIAEAKKLEEQGAIAQGRQDSIKKQQAAQRQEKVTPRKGERYEEAVNEEGIPAGYYLIANVFRTKRYYEAFMKSLTEQGLNPKSFYRASKRFNYIYLGKYNTIDEARKARDSQLNGRYKEDLWIFRVVATE